MQTRWLIFLPALLLAASPAVARQARSHRSLALFRQLVPCPSTGLFKGPCPQYRADHWIPICLGPGFDEAWLLHWQPLAASIAKDKLEWAMCRSAKAHPKG